MPQHAPAGLGHDAGLVELQRDAHRVEVVIQRRPRDPAAFDGEQLGPEVAAETKLTGLTLRLEAIELCPQTIRKRRRRRPKGPHLIAHGDPPAAALPQE